MNKREREKHRLYMREWRKAHPEENRASERKYKRTHRKEILARCWRAKADNPEVFKAYRDAAKKKNIQRWREQKQAWSKKNQEKARIYRLIYRAVKFGELVRLDYCVACGLVCKPQGHHGDYSKPLEVIWLCHWCHQKRHRSLNPLQLPAPAGASLRKEER